MLQQDRPHTTRSPDFFQSGQQDRSLTYQDVLEDSLEHVLISIQWELTFDVGNAPSFTCLSSSRT